MTFGAAHGGSVRMFGVAAFGGRIGRRATCCLSTSARDYLREVALADLGCAAVGAFMAAQVRFDRIIGTGPAEYRKVLNAWVSLTAAVAIFSYASNLELSRVYVVIVLPGVTLLDMATRLALRKRLRR